MNATKKTNSHVITNHTFDFNNTKIIKSEEITKKR